MLLPLRVRYKCRGAHPATLATKLPLPPFIFSCSITVLPIASQNLQCATSTCSTTGRFASLLGGDNTLKQNCWTGSLLQLLLLVSRTAAASHTSPSISTEGIEGPDDGVKHRDLHKPPKKTSIQPPVSIVKVGDSSPLPLQQIWGHESRAHRVARTPSENGVPTNQPNNQPRN